MKKMSLLLCVVNIALLHAYDLRVNIEGLKSDTGEVSIGVYDTKETFLKKHAELEGHRVTITNSKSFTTFKNLKKKKYAIAIYHDENLNGVLDSNFLGIPKEGFAFSNNVVSLLSAPSFDEASFILNKDINITLLTNY